MHIFTILYGLGWQLKSLHYITLALFCPQSLDSEATAAPIPNTTAKTVPSRAAPPSPLTLSPTPPLPYPSYTNRKTIAASATTSTTKSSQHRVHALQHTPAFSTRLLNNKHGEAERKARDCLM
jgi:hypothetical protein